jgi:hypothetical protein
VDEATGQVFVTDEEKHVLDVFGAAAPAPSVSTGEASVSATEVKLSGEVNPESGSLPASYEFEYATEAEYDENCNFTPTEKLPEVLWEGLCASFTHSVPASAVSVGTGTTGVPASAPLPLSALAQGTPYRYRIVGYNANADGSNGRVEGETKSFFTPGPPVIEEQWVTEVGSGSATLNARIAPGNLATKYRLEYGSSEAYGQKSAELSLPAGTAPVTVSVPLSELPESSVFHARFVAENALSELEGKPGEGGDLQFVTFSSLTGLPDGRGYELVTPVENHDAEVFSPANSLEPSTRSGLAPYLAAADGGGIAYEGQATPEGNGEEGAGLANQYLARRSGSGWVQSALSAQGHDSVVYEGFSSDLGMSVFRAGGSAAGGEGGDEKAPVLPEVEVPLTQPVLYVRDDETGAMRALFTHLGSDSEPLAVNFAGGSEDFNTLLFEATAALTLGAPPSGQSVNDLYEWVEGRLSLVNVLPEGKGPEPDASFGAPDVSAATEAINPDRGAEQSNDISRDGSRVFWTGLQSHGLYMSEAGGEAVQLDVPNENCGKVCKAGEGVFWTATPDGSQAFFTDPNRLTEASTASPEVPAKGGTPAVPGQSDLYEYDLQRPEGERLLDLTVAPEGQHAGVQAVLGSSVDGSYVYFVANGVLSGTERNGNGEVARQGACVPFHGEGQCNLYVWHQGAIHFIAALSGHDGLDLQTGSDGTTTDPGGDWTQSLAFRTSQVTPSGGDVLFLSNNRLTGYDNEGLPEAYVYDAASNQLSCASCNTSGERPALPAPHSPLIHDYGAALPQGHDQAQTMNWMSADGDRVFFESGQSLVPQATNSSLYVYEWERDGAGECHLPGGCVYLLSGGHSEGASYLLGASADGDDVFIATRGQLVPEDENENYDVYDVRVGAKGPVGAPACTGTGCQGVPAAPPIFATPSTATFEGLGNFPPPSPLIVKPKVKTVKCAKGKKRNKHNQCVKVKTKKKSKGRKSASNDRRASR